VMHEFIAVHREEIISRCRMKVDASDPVWLMNCQP
jgi:hypothetical protein